MKSKTVAFNVFFLCGMVCFIIIATLISLPAWMYVALIVVDVAISQYIPFKNPSGTFITHGRNWTVWKWLGRIALVVIAVTGIVTGKEYITQGALLATPVFEIIMRRFGSYSKNQESVYRKNSLKGRSVTRMSE